MWAKSPEPAHYKKERAVKSDTPFPVGCMITYKVPDLVDCSITSYSIVLMAGFRVKVLDIEMYKHAKNRKKNANISVFLILL